MADSPSLTSLVLEAVKEKGFELAGVAAAAPAVTWEFYRDWVEQGFGAGMGYLGTSLELRRTLDSILPGARSVVAVGLNYCQEPNWQPGEPRIARYALGSDYHRVIRSRLAKAAKALESLAPQARHRAAVDSAPILEREWAQRAGLGWPGKNTCLINSERGSWFLLGFLLTTLELEPTGAAQGGCGRCRACIEACPTGALVKWNGRWIVDSRQCISYWTIEHKGEIPPEIEAGIGSWTFGCDVCQEVCPFNQPRPSQPNRARQTEDNSFVNRKRFPKLEQLAAVSREEWNRISEGSPLRRAGLEGIRRNAQINLRNQGS